MLPKSSSSPKYAPVAHQNDQQQPCADATQSACESAALHEVKIDGTPSKWNRNVMVVLIYTFIVQLGRSIWQSQLLTIYLYNLCGDMRLVGYIEGVQGIARLITAMLTGIAIDGWIRKHKNMALRVSCVYGICFFAATAFCVMVVRKTWVWFLLLGLYSPQRSLQMSAVGTIFADSMTTGDRVQVYSVYRVVSNLGAVLGPTVQIMFFLYAGNHWSAENLRIVMLVGIACSASALPLQLFIDQNRTLGDSSEAKQRQASVKDQRHEEEIAQDEYNACLLRWSIVVYDLFRVLFGGIVDKYFGVFFQDHLGVRPIQLALIQMACRVGIIITTAAVGGLASYVPAAILCLGLLFFVNLANTTLAINPGSLVWVAVVAYIVRGTSLVSIFGLKHALLMDRVPKKHRGKFSALDDLQSGFWSGTAAIGGTLIHNYGYGLAFGVMASGFGGATLSWLGVVYSDCRAKRLDAIGEDGKEDDEESSSTAKKGDTDSGRGQKSSKKRYSGYSGGTTYSGQLETTSGVFSRNDSMLFGDGFALDSDSVPQKPLPPALTVRDHLRQPLVSADHDGEEEKTNTGPSPLV